MPGRSDAERTSTAAAWLLALGLLALRLPHLTGPLDDPHSWRQCDTVHYSLDLFRRGLDVLHPAVCWLGAHRTLVLEFPLTEAMAALLYRIGGPDALWDRLVSLAWFVVAAAYFHAAVRLVASRRAAALATLAYLALPLGQFYSRAAQADFAATAGAHALLYHGARAMRDRSWAHASAGAALGAVGALVKGPYLLPVLPPLAAFLALAPDLAARARGAAAVGVPALAFAWWRRHADAVNATAPDWSFLPGYYKESDAASWYFGNAHQRFETAGYLKVGRRVLVECATPLGALLGIAGLGARATDDGRPGARGVAVLWAFGTVLYLLVFFPLNVIHSYYQIPFLAPVALAIGLGADAVWRTLPARPVALGGGVFAVFLVLAALAPQRLGYYRIDWLREEAGLAIAARVPARDLMVASDYGAGYSDPRLLQRADREGWSVAVPDLTPERVERLASLGARWVAVVTDPGHPQFSPPAFLTSAAVADTALAHDGVALGMLHLYALRRIGAVARP